MIPQFETTDFNSQITRSLGRVSRRFASVGEVAAVSRQIEDGNTESWHSAWLGLAERLEEWGEEARERGDLVGAGDAYRRASEAHRQATFFCRDDLDDARLQDGWPRARDCFRAAADLGSWPWEAVRIPFEDSYLHGYLFFYDDSGRKRSTVISPSGYDGTAEEAFVMNGIPALLRGYNAVLFDGPGQGNTLYDPETRLLMRPDWENILPAVVDFVSGRSEVDEGRLAAIGASFGGYLVPRGVSGDDRIAALIADPGQYDLGAAVKDRLPASLADRFEDPSAADRFAAILESPKAKLQFLPRMAAHGIDSVQEYVRDLQRYHLRDRAPYIRCPTLICDNATDVISAGQGESLAAVIGELAEFVRFTGEEGAGGHCEGAGREVYEHRVFAWLAEIVPPSEPRGATWVW